jgi:hypothetical protein
MSSDQSNRCEFVTLVGGAVLGWPLAALVQLGERLRRIAAVFG